MKKQFLFLLLLAGGLASMSAKTEPISGDECPDRCQSNITICCTTSGGSTYYGFIGG